MYRRQLLELAAGAVARAAQKNDSAVAAASLDTTPRVGIVLSSFKGSEDHDGTKLTGLRNPSPPGGPLSAVQLEAMVRKALELGNTRRGGLETIIEAEDWVVVKPHIAGKSVADPRVVRTLIAWLVEHRLSRRLACHHCGHEVPVPDACPECGTPVPAGHRPSVTSAQAMPGGNMSP